MKKIFSVWIYNTRTGEWDYPLFENERKAKIILDQKYDENNYEIDEINYWDYFYLVEGVYKDQDFDKLYLYEQEIIDDINNVDLIVLWTVQPETGWI